MSDDKIKGGAPGGAHSYGPPTPFEEATRKELDRMRIARETDPRAKAQHERLQAELEKVRARKAKRKASNPYDFG